MVKMLPDETFSSIWVNREEICTLFRFINTPAQFCAGFVRFLENLESPGILLCHFPEVESPGKRPLVLERSGIC